jgi:two-component system heavy metal sensor histidine kinase CusS
MKRAPRSITLRITLLFAAAATAVLLALGQLVSVTVEAHFIEQDREQLAGKLELLAHILQQVWLPEDLSGLPRRIDEALVGHHDIALQVTGAQGAVLYATPDITFPAAITTASGDALPQWQQHGQLWRASAATLPTGIDGMPPLGVAIAIDATHHELFLERFRRTLWLFIAAAAALTGLLGWWSVRRGLAPLRAMVDETAGVTASQLDRRLDAEAVPAELAELARALNDMLQRLQDAFRRLTDFSSDLAHELRTPVSNLVTGTEVALGRARSADEYRDLLASHLEEYERLSRMIADMLFLAQADNGLVIPRREAVDLARQVRELLDFFDALAAEKALALHVDGSATVTGDTLMLRRALANLLSNAIRHAPENGSVCVRITGNGSGARIDIENTGEPIPAEHRARIFDRFYRADPSRHRHGEGAGLGLAITQAIARAHGGDITLHCAAGAVRFSLQLPREA